MSLQVQGSLIKLLPEQKGEGRNGTWVKREFIIETTEEFPKKICFSIWGDKSKDLANLKLNDFVKVSFDISSREYNDKWYSDIRAWKIEKADNKPTNSKAPETPPIPENDIPPEIMGSDDLPF